MSRFGNDALALACIAGGALASGAATWGLAASAAGGDEVEHTTPAVPCEQHLLPPVVHFAPHPHFRVTIGEGAPEIELSPRAEARADCLSPAHLHELGEEQRAQLEAELERMRERLDRTRDEAERSRERLERQRERLERAREQELREIQRLEERLRRQGDRNGR